MSIAVENALKGGTYIWGAPTFDQVRIGFGETRHACGDYASFNVSRMTVTFPKGGRIIFRSLDNPDNARGYTADGVVVDESADVAPEAWYEVLRPMLIDTSGWAWLIGTPKGRNWYWQEHVRAQDMPDAMTWQVPTLGVALEDGKLMRRPHLLENPHIPFEEVCRLRETMPERVFEQEILAQFIETSGGVFRHVLDAATATTQDAAIRPHSYVVGVDWGRSDDFTVITVVDLQARSVVFVDRFNQIDYQLQLGRLQAVYERFRPIVVLAEANSMGTPLIDQLRRTEIPVKPFTTTNATKAEAIDALALAFEQGTIRIPNDPVLINELQAYEMERLPSGLLRYSAPPGMHDDCVMSLAIAWQAALIPPKRIARSYEG